MLPVQHQLAFKELTNKAKVLSVKLGGTVESLALGKRICSKSLWWVGGWLKPILAFSLSLDQTEQHWKGKASNKMLSNLTFLVPPQNTVGTFKIPLTLLYSIIRKGL